MKINYIECDCHSDEHVLRFIENEEDNEIIVSAFLNSHLGFFQRVKVAFKYLLGHATKEHFDCTIINKEEAKKLIAILNKTQFEQDDMRRYVWFTEWFDVNYSLPNLHDVYVLAKYKNLADNLVQYCVTTSEYVVKNPHWFTHWKYFDGMENKIVSCKEV